MRKTLAAGLAALTFGGAVAAAALPTAAEARPHGYYGGGYYGGGYYGHHNNNDAALVAGIAGLAIGAAIASNNHPHYYGGYGYAPGYYGYYPRMCESRRWVWDPYIGRRVMVTSRYEC